ncbi:MAG: outer membrane beta-barrel protein [Deltaproteobacteria bacterium]|nr:outer membrane beta-barrel protein [Deltaproteobacteria bacterium]
MKTTCLPAIIRIFVVVLLATGVSASSAARGLGIKAGEGRLHPSLDLDLVYDTNPSYASEDVFSDLVLRIRPGIALSFPSEVVEFELEGKVGYDYFFGIDKKNNLSSVAGEADMRLGFNPKGQVSFFIEDTFSRSSDPRYGAVSGRFDRTNNEAKAHLQIKPGGGALMFDLAYGFFIDWFDDSGSNSTALSNYGHRAYFSGKWKFLPKTAVTVDFDADIRRYPNSYTGGAKNSDVNAIRATVGMLGQISPSIAITIKAGYGDTLLPSDNTGSDYRSAIGQAEMTFKSGTTFIQFGYSRNFQPVVMFSYFGQDRVYARLRQQIAGKFTLALDASYDYLAYGDDVTGDQQDGRTDHFVSGGLSFDYHIIDWIEVGLAYDIQARISGWQQVTAPGGSQDVDYNKHMFTLHIGVDY